MALAFRAKPCITCGAIFSPNSPSARYCDGCRDEARRRSSRNHYHRRSADPDFNRVRHVRAVKRALEADGMEALRAIRRRSDLAYKARVKADPERAAETRVYGAKWRREARAVFREVDPDGFAEFQARLREAARDYQREWARARRADMTEAEKAEARAKRRSWLAERELRALQAEIRRRL